METPSNEEAVSSHAATDTWLKDDEITVRMIAAPHSPFHRFRMHPHQLRHHMAIQHSSNSYFVSMRILLIVVSSSDVP